MRVLVEAAGIEPAAARTGQQEIRGVARGSQLSPRCPRGSTPLTGGGGLAAAGARRVSGRGWALVAAAGLAVALAVAWCAPRGPQPDRGIQALPWLRGATSTPYTPTPTSGVSRRPRCA